ncbi:hypothetical protein CERSUDRAFT_147767 [Gelatoporia subvermispora B]|uniref:Uncharacterized protein n=1 Tax=Ceriporiopsis subvermispora (strain B) TaxID=914234 RepID=M2RCI3_CERS8|nr:hypothetical protein CERSUDRAFT_147767 [Gelatoporia subvermispora B]
MTDTTSVDIKQLLGEHPSSPKIVVHLNNLASLATSPQGTTPEIKSYPDAVYFNYYSLGLSLLFKPINMYRPRTNLGRDDLKDADLVLDGIDIYNVPPPKPGASPEQQGTTRLIYATYPVSPVVLSLAPGPSADEATPRAAKLEITPNSTGKDFVQAMGEPDRKGGGAGPSSGSIGIWCEWSKDGVMVEFGGDESKGPKAWETGKDAVWKVISIFPPKED